VMVPAAMSLSIAAFTAFCRSATRPARLLP
jgi:hypothetical protein